MLIMGFATIVISIIYVFLLQWITKPLLYSTLILVEVVLLGMAYYSYASGKDFENSDPQRYQAGISGAAVCGVFALLFLIFIFCNWGNIALGASIMEAAADFLSSNSRVGLLPILTYILVIPISIWWLVSTVFLYTMGETSF
jgi:hypothetical protein